MWGRIVRFGPKIYGNLLKMDRTEHREHRKRKRERFIILGLAAIFALLTAVEFRLGKISASLPFVNSIFFFGLINFNIVILVALLWLIFKKVGQMVLDQNSKHTSILTRNHESLL